MSRTKTKKAKPAKLKDAPSAQAIFNQSQAMIRRLERQTMVALTTSQTRLMDVARLTDENTLLKIQNAELCRYIQALSTPSGNAPLPQSAWWHRAPEPDGGDDY